MPIVGKHLIAYSGYQGGVSVIDLTNPKAAKEIGYVDPISPQTGASGNGCWTGYWYNDSLYCSELDWGMHVFTLNEPWWKQALNFDELNPQTNTKLIRCNVSVIERPEEGRPDEADHGQGEPVRARPGAARLRPQGQGDRPGHLEDAHRGRERSRQHLGPRHEARVAEGHRPHRTRTFPSAVAHP